MSMKSPTVRHRRLGRELRRLRENAGLSVAEVAVQLGWSVSKVNRIENARIALTPSSVSHACDLFGADSSTKAGLIQLCKDAAVRGWWTAYHDVFGGSYVVLEADASVIRTWEPLLIPGLLQHKEYAQELIRGGRPDLGASDIERRVAARMTRKIHLLGPNAPTFHALVDEGALRRPIGPSSVMACQLDDLLQVADRPNVTIQILPLAAGPHIGLDGAFSVLSFDPEDPDVGYTGCPGGDVYVEATDQVRSLRVAFERLIDTCLSPEESTAVIAEARSEHDRP
ncbi:helix-turn-helix domain-containing protein [Streptosporangium carneum]|nr:helix-turn-helix transcriptional regulator [Streptosporangium carneum]